MEPFILKNILCGNKLVKSNLANESMFYFLNQSINVDVVKMILIGVKLTQEEPH
jgi:hypothetical protein